MCDFKSSTNHYFLIVATFFEGKFFSKKFFLHQKTYVKKNSTAKGKKPWPACSFKYFAFYVGLVLIHCRNKMFMLNEMFQGNTSKSTILLCIVNPCSFFVFHFVHLYFSPSFEHFIEHILLIFEE